MPIGSILTLGGLVLTAMTAVASIPAIVAISNLGIASALGAGATIQIAGISLGAVVGSIIFAQRSLRLSLVVGPAVMALGFVVLRASAAGELPIFVLAELLIGVGLGCTLTSAFGALGEVVEPVNRPIGVAVLLLASIPSEALARQLGRSAEGFIVIAVLLALRGLRAAGVAPTDTPRTLVEAPIRVVPGTFLALGTIALLAGTEPSGAVLKLIEPGLFSLADSPVILGQGLTLVGAATVVASLRLLVDGLPDRAALTAVTISLAGAAFIGSAGLTILGVLASLAGEPVAFIDAAGAATSIGVVMAAAALWSTYRPRRVATVGSAIALLGMVVAFSAADGDHFVNWAVAGGVAALLGGAAAVQVVGRSLLTDAAVATRGLLAAVGVFAVAIGARLGVHVGEVLVRGGADYASTLPHQLTLVLVVVTAPSIALRLTSHRVPALTHA